ncbi:MAG: hypothetical protein ACI395_03365 [Candidatus Cryptobacteroides sp.]
MKMSDNMRLCRIRHIAGVVLSFAVVLCTVVCCTSISYGYIDYGDGQTQPNDRVSVQFSVGWPSGIGQAGIPETCSVLMSRITNEVHYIWEVSSEPEVPELPDPDAVEVPDGSEVVFPGTDDSEGNDLPSVFAGDYYSIAFAYGGNTGENAYNIENIEEFRTDTRVGMKEVYAQVPVMSKDKVKEKFGEDLNDFNPSLPYLYETEPLYLDVRKIVNLLPGDPKYSIDFEMRDLTMNLTIRLNVRHEDEVTVDKLIADLSGIPSQICLMNGVVTKDRTGRVVFNMERVQREGTIDVYEAKIRSLGLLSAESSSLKTGLGILRVSLTASCGEVSRVFYAGINLKKEIDNSRLMLMTSDNLGYTARLDSTTEDRLIEVGTELTVSIEQVETAGNEGIGGWFDDNDDIEVEL